MSVPCVHRRLVDDCPVCTGYWRWLAACKNKPACTNTPSARKEFWRTGGWAIGEQARYIRDRRMADSPGPIA
jgi:hypothetical protein